MRRTCHAEPVVAGAGPWAPAGPAAADTIDGLVVIAGCFVSAVASAHVSAYTRAGDNPGPLARLVVSRRQPIASIGGSPGPEAGPWTRDSEGPSPTRRSSEPEPGCGLCVQVQRLSDPDSARSDALALAAG